MQVVIAGTGYTGSRLLARFDPSEVIGVGRSAPAIPGRFRQLDLDRGADDLECPSAYAVVYTIPPAEDSASDRRLERFLALLDPPPGRFVYLSTSGVYGDRGGGTVDERAAPAPQTDRARRRLAAETLLETWCADAGCARVVLRVPGIYGPGRLGLERLRAGEPVLLASDANPGNRIHVDDLVECCVAALRPEVPAGVYNVGDGDYRSASWFAGAVAAAAGLPPPRAIGRAEAESLFSRRRLSFLGESRRLDVRKMREVLGVKPRNPETGIAESLA